VQKEQIAEELSNMKKRFDTYILDTQARVLEERESVRRESQMMIDTINKKVCSGVCYLEMSVYTGRKSNDGRHNQQKGV
jgi:hypothetical protein